MDSTSFLIMPAEGGQSQAAAINTVNARIQPFLRCPKTEYVSLQQRMRALYRKTRFPAEFTPSPFFRSGRSQGEGEWARNETVPTCPSMTRDGNLPPEGKTPIDLPVAPEYPSFCNSFQLISETRGGYVHRAHSPNDWVQLWRHLFVQWPAQGFSVEVNHFSGIRQFTKERIP